jgi:hypothetical protein
MSMSTFGKKVFAFCASALKVTAIETPMIII